MRECAHATNAKISSWLWVLLIVLQWTGLMSAAEVPVVAENKKPQEPAVLSAATAVEGRRHPSYQVFAAQAQLPSISQIQIDTIEIGGRVKLNVGRALEFGPPQIAVLSEEFEVPRALLDKFQKRWLANPQANASQLAQDLRTTVIDYRYLKARWASYRPPLEGENAKEEALLALSAGDLEKTWSMYAALRKPVAPTGLRISSPTGGAPN